MPPWPPETLARWERRSRRVLLVAGLLLLAAHLLPRPRIDDGDLRWLTPFDDEQGVFKRFPHGPGPLVPHTLAVVALGAWYVVAARLRPLARRGAAAAWASVGLVLAVAAARVQRFNPWGEPLWDKYWPWWDGSVVIPALGLLLVNCPGRRRFGRALCVLAGCAGIAPLLLAPAWNLDHFEYWGLAWEGKLWARMFAVARGLSFLASIALLWFGLAPRRARGRRLLATRLWLGSLLAAVVAGVAAFVGYADRTSTAVCAGFGYVLELGKQMAPHAGMVVGLFLVIATSRRPAEPPGPAA